MATTATREATATRVKPATIDADIHNTVPSERALLPYLPPAWRAYYEQFGFRNYRYTGAYYPRVSPAAARTDAWPPNGAPPGADLPFLREQLLDAWGIEYGILNPIVDENCPTQLHSEYGAAIAAAINDWQIAEWLEPEPRLRASMVVAAEDGELAAAEIARRAGDSRFVQVLLLARSSEPLGRRKYWPMYEAAQRHSLPVAVHFGGLGGRAITGSGWPYFYLEDHVGMPQTFQAHVASLIFEGVFERFPDLKLIIIEGGIAWLPPFMWRMDRAWEQLRAEVPHVRRPPSEYVRQHLWVTTQPMEEPPRRGDFLQLLRHLDMNDKIMFATDYPHWDFDAPDAAFPVRLPPDLEQKFMAGNARALYGL
ncbi:MAG: amidohydrolase [Thermomicrobiales bacterium]|nr:amidohydrolase [Thermomicrobiales bacterium]